MKNFWKKYHKWVGLFFSFFILMFCFSGIVLNHRTLFSKAEVSRNWMPESYHYKNWNNGIIREHYAYPMGKFWHMVMQESGKQTPALLHLPISTEVWPKESTIIK